MAVGRKSRIAPYLGTVVSNVSRGGAPYETKEVAVPHRREMERQGF